LPLNAANETKVSKINEIQDFIAANVYRSAETPLKYPQAPTNIVLSNYPLYLTSNPALVNKIQSETYKESKINQFQPNHTIQKKTNQLLPI
jgi:hypothetical protein